MRRNSSSQPAGGAVRPGHVATVAPLRDSEPAGSGTTPVRSAQEDRSQSATIKQFNTDNISTLYPGFNRGGRQGSLPSTGLVGRVSAPLSIRSLGRSQQPQSSVARRVRELLGGRSNAEPSGVCWVFVSAPSSLTLCFSFLSLRLLLVRTAPPVPHTHTHTQAHTQTHTHKHTHTYTLELQEEGVAKERGSESIGGGVGIQGGA